MRFLLAALCCLLLAPAAAQAGTPFQLGVQDDAVLTGGNPVMSPVAGLAAMKKIHANVVRLNVPMAWTLTTDPHSKTAPKTPTYEFGSFDSAIARIRAAGSTVQLTVTGPAPAWATGDKKLGTYKLNATKFAQFSAAVAAHFGTDVTAISILNEPNWPTTLAPIKGKCKTTTVRGKRKKVCADLRPQLYRSIYAASYTAIKKVAPTTPVWIGELSPQGRSTTKGAALSPLSFLRTAMCVDTKVKKKTCAGLRTDGLALHPYYLGEPPTAKPKSPDDLSMAALPRATTLLAKLEKLKALRLSNGKAGIPIYLTEFGYLTIKGVRGVSESKQAAYIPQAIKMAKKASRVRQLVLYELIDPYDKNASWIGGLYSRAGKAKPVVAKLAALR